VTIPKKYFTAVILIHTVLHIIM